MPDPVNVALSVDSLSPQLTGIGRYCLELVRGLRDRDGIGRVSYFQGNCWLNDPEVLLNTDWRSPAGKFRRKIGNLYGRARARHAVVHGPNYFLPRWAEQGIVTVHDLSVLLYPQTHPLERVKYFERHFHDTLARTCKVITDSETIRNEVIRHLGVASDRVVAIPLGVKKPGPPNPSADIVLSHYGLRNKGYTLCLSTFEPRKRIDRLVEAYAHLAPALRQSFPLVLVGAQGWLSEQLHTKIEAGQAAGWLKRLDYISDLSRDAIYRGARLFVYPSLYEGFGLPPLEAMIQGVPTIIGNAETLIEVTKGAARATQVEDLEEFSQVLSDSLQDDTWRDEAIRQGLRVAHGYTWELCVNKTIEIYKEIFN